MLKLGYYALTGGAAVTLLGLLGGLSALFLGVKSWGMSLIGIVPFSFLLAFCGLVIVVMLGERDQGRASPSQVLPDADDD